MSTGFNPKNLQLEQLPGWRNWYTRRTQNPLSLQMCGFESRPGHLISHESSKSILKLNLCQKSQNIFSLGDVVKMISQLRNFRNVSKGGRL